MPNTHISPQSARSQRPARPSASPTPEAIKRLLPWIIAVAFFMESLDTTILNTGMPVISKALGVSALSMKSVLSSYTLSLAVFIPISGWMADRFGTRRVFTGAIALFTLGSLLCGLTTNVHMLVACRVLQGMGGAMMVPVGRLTLVRSFAKSELIRAMSFVAIPTLIAPMFGPLVGGLIVAYLHWRVIFFINIPIGIIGMVLIWLNLPDYSDKNVKPLDVLGLILFSSGIALLSYVLEIFGEHQLSPSEVLGLLAISVLLLVGYGLHATRTAWPLLQMTLFRTRTFAAAVGGGFFTRLGLGGAPFLLPLLYQMGLGLTPVQSGLLIMPQAIASLSTKFLLPRILGRLGYRTVLISNTLALGLLLMMFGTIDRGTPIWLIVTQAMVYGILTSLQFTSMNSLVYADVPPKRTSNASTIASTAQQLSLSFSVAAAGLLTLFFLPSGTTTGPGLTPDVMISGLHKAFFVLGGFTIASTLVFIRLKNDDGSIETQTKDVHLEK